jgi:hypothetical protein
MDQDYIKNSCWPGAAGGNRRIYSFHALAGAVIELSSPLKKVASAAEARRKYPLRVKNEAKKRARRR